MILGATLYNLQIFVHFGRVSLAFAAAKLVLLASQGFARSLAFWVFAISGRDAAECLESPLVRAGSDLGGSNMMSTCLQQSVN